MSKDNISAEDIKVNVNVPNIVGLTYKEAKKNLEECGLQITTRQEIGKENEFVITNQIPSSGVQILEGSSVIVE